MKIAIIVPAASAVAAVGLIACALVMDRASFALGDPPATGQFVAFGGSTGPADAVESALAFQAEIASLRVRIEKAGAVPTPIENALWRRINHHLEITDQSVQATVNCWSGYEGMKANNAGRVLANPYRHTKDMIDALLVISDAWPSRVAWLHQKKAELLWVEGDQKEALAEFELSIKAITPVHIDVDLRRLACLVGEGDAAAWIHDKDRADAAYLEALSYDWYKIADADGQRAARNLYIDAGTRIIELRRHNLEKLKELNFVPSTLDVLGPRLKKAIAEK